MLASFKSDGRLDRPYVVGVRDVQFRNSKQLRFFCFGGLCSNENYEETHIFSSRDFPNHTPQECGGVEPCLCGQLLLEIYNGDGGLRDIMRGGVSGNVHEVSYKNPGSRTRTAFTGLAVRTQPDPFSYGIVRHVKGGYNCLTCTSNKGSCKHVKIILGRGDLNNPVERKSIGIFCAQNVGDAPVPCRQSLRRIQLLHSRSVCDWAGRLLVMFLRPLSIF